VHSQLTMMNRFVDLNFDTWIFKTSINFCISGLESDAVPIGRNVDKPMR